MLLLHTSSGARVGTICLIHTLHQVGSCVCACVAVHMNIAHKNRQYCSISRQHFVSQSTFLHILALWTGIEANANRQPPLPGLAWSLNAAHPVLVSVRQCQLCCILVGWKSISVHMAYNNIESTSTDITLHE